jgi:hypothetical protein
MHEYQKKGVARIAIHKRMKMKKLFLCNEKVAICKYMKRKTGAFRERRGGGSRIGIVGIHPGGFRMSGK